VFRGLLIVLMVTQKGLTLREIKATVGASDQQVSLFFAVFKVFCMRFKGYWMLKNDAFKRAVQRRYGARFVGFHERIAVVLESTPKSIRKLEEQTFHLFMAKNYFMLKEIVSEVENFLLLFNPYNKYDLCKYWQLLEDKYFDPVFEYNKTVEGFETHFHPSSEDLFSIIVQISRFFREFSDFENYSTPGFKHPKILGAGRHFLDINMFGELRELELLYNPSVEQEEEPYPEDGADEVKDKVNAYLARILRMDRRLKKKEESLDVLRLDAKEIPRRKEAKRKHTGPLLLNLEIPINRAEIVRHYQKEVQKYIEAHEKERREQREEEQERGQDPDKEPNFHLPPINYSKLARTDFELQIPYPENYYYKRWIWLQFPWVCLSLRLNYSKTMKRCFKSAT
jgi:hypothetical protein